MNIFITVLTIAFAITFGAIIIKVVIHPTAGKIQTYYKDQYDEYHRRNFPPH